MSLKLAKVPAGYCCSFCVCADHGGDFWESKVFGRPICGPYRFEISFFIENPEREEDPVVVAVEQLTGVRGLRCGYLCFRKNWKAGSPWPMMIPRM